MLSLFVLRSDCGNDLRGNPSRHFHTIVVRVDGKGEEGRERERRAGKGREGEGKEGKGKRGEGKKGRRKGRKRKEGKGTETRYGKGREGMGFSGTGPSSRCRFRPQHAHTGNTQSMQRFAISPLVSRR
jgi:hypothetical protein